MSYQYALNYDNVAGLVDWPNVAEKPPRIGGLRGGRRVSLGNGSVVQDGFQSCTVDYGFLTAAELNTLFNTFQLDPENGSTSRGITVSLPANIDRNFANYNAIIVAPDFPSNGEYVRGKWGPVQFTLQRINPI